jgi:hypothetical protein
MVRRARPHHERLLGQANVPPPPTPSGGASSPKRGRRWSLASRGVLAVLIAVSGVVRHFFAEPGQASAAPAWARVVAADAHVTAAHRLWFTVYVDGNPQGTQVPQLDVAIVGAHGAVTTVHAAFGPPGKNGVRSLASGYLSDPRNGSRTPLPGSVTGRFAKGTAVLTVPMSSFDDKPDAWRIVSYGDGHAYPWPAKGTLPVPRRLDLHLGAIRTRLVGRTLSGSADLAGVPAGAPVHVVLDLTGTRNSTVALQFAPGQVRATKIASHSNPPMWNWQTLVTGATASLAGGHLAYRVHLPFPPDGVCCYRITAQVLDGADGNMLSVPDMRHAPVRLTSG